MLTSKIVANNVITPEQKRVAKLLLENWRKKSIRGMLANFHSDHLKMLPRTEIQDYYNRIQHRFRYAFFDANTSDNFKETFNKHRRQRESYQQNLYPVFSSLIPKEDAVFPEYKMTPLSSCIQEELKFSKLYMLCLTPDAHNMFSSITHKKLNNKAELDIIVRALFSETQNLIPWSYMEKGCYSRAKIMVDLLSLIGISLETINIQYVSFEEKFSKHGWHCHFAPIIRLDNGSAYVIDPSLEPSQSLKLEEWIQLQTKPEWEMENVLLDCWMESLSIEQVYHRDQEREQQLLGDFRIAEEKTWLNSMTKR